MQEANSRQSSEAMGHAKPKTDKSISRCPQLEAADKSQHFRKSIKRNESGIIGEKISTIELNEMGNKQSIELVDHFESPIPSLMICVEEGAQSNFKPRKSL